MDCPICGVLCHFYVSVTVVPANISFVVCHVCVLLLRAKVPVETRDQVILARRFTGEEARATGLVHEVCSGPHMTESALSAAARLTDGKPHQQLHRETLATIKRQLYSDTHDALSRGISFPRQHHHKSKL